MLRAPDDQLKFPPAVPGVSLKPIGSVLLEGDHYFLWQRTLGRDERNELVRFLSARRRRVTFVPARACFLTNPCTTMREVLRAVHFEFPDSPNNEPVRRRNSPKLQETSNK